MGRIKAIAFSDNYISILICQTVPTVRMNNAVNQLNELGYHLTPSESNYLENKIEEYKGDLL